MPWMWVFPIILSAAFDGTPPRRTRAAYVVIPNDTANIAAASSLVLDYEPANARRRWPTIGRFDQLAGYAVATALIDAATVGGMVPRHVDARSILFDTLSLTGPLHLLATPVIEWLAQRFWRLVRTLDGADADPITIRPGFVIAIASVGLLGGLFPTVYSATAHHRDAVFGRASADDEWAAQAAGIFVDPGDSRQEYVVNDVRIQRYRDLATGLELRTSFRLGYEPAYNNRITEKLATEKSPAQAVISQLPTDDELVALLQSAEMTRIQTFPCKLTPDVEVDGLGSVAAAHLSFGTSAPKSVYFCRLPKRRGVVFIRFDDTMVAAFSDEGELLVTATRDQ